MRSISWANVGRSWQRELIFGPKRFSDSSAQRAERAPWGPSHTVIFLEIVGDDLGVGLVDWSAEGIDHLDDLRIPPRSIEERGVHDHVIEAVTGAAMRLDLVAPRRIFELDRLLRSCGPGSEYPLLCHIYLFFDFIGMLPSIRSFQCCFIRSFQYSFDTLCMAVMVTVPRPPALSPMGTGVADRMALDFSECAESPVVTLSGQSQHRFDTLCMAVMVAVPRASALSPMGAGVADRMALDFW